MNKKKIKEVMKRISKGNYKKNYNRLHSLDKEGNDCFCMWGAITNEYVLETGDYDNAWCTTHVPSRFVIDWLDLKNTSELTFNDHTIFSLNDTTKLSIKEIADLFIKEL